MRIFDPRLFYFILFFFCRTPIWKNDKWKVCDKRNLNTVFFIVVGGSHEGRRTLVHVCVCVCTNYQAPRTSTLKLLHWKDYCRCGVIQQSDKPCRSSPQCCAGTELHTWPDYPTLLLGAKRSTLGRCLPTFEVIHHTLRRCAITSYILQNTALL